LKEATLISREALVHTNYNSNPDRETLLEARLAMQYSRTGISANLDGTIQVTQEAFASTPADYDKGQTLGTVEDYLADIFSRTVTRADLQDAISLIQEALGCSPTQSFAPANTTVQSLLLYSQEIFKDQEHR